MPSASAATLVATLQYASPELSRKRGLSPNQVVSNTVVVRIDDSVHKLWDDADDTMVARRLGKKLNDTLAEIEAGGIEVREVQLDYDAPVRRLSRWAAVVKRLRARELKGVSLWITSIPAHIAQPEYGELFRGSADGHILQLFDTGLPCNDEQQQQLADQLANQRWRYRIGVGAFERGQRTQHGCWLSRWQQLSHHPGFSGVWIFPAGHPYLQLFDS